jgi:formyl-CoA transferase
MGILVALVERAQSGRGQHVSTSLLEALTGSLSFQAVKYLNTGEAPPPVGNHHPLTAPMGVYRARDGFINLAVGNDDMWVRLCRALGVPELAADERFAKNQGRTKHREAMDAVIVDRLASRSMAEWIQTFNEAGVACGPIYTVAQVLADPQVQQAAFVHEHEHEAYGPVKVLGLPVSLSRTPATVRTPAAVPGAHTRDMMSDLGYSAHDIDALAAAGVIEVTK